MTATTYGADRVDDPAAEAGEGARGLGPAEHGLAAQLDRQQVEARVEPDDELAALPLDGIGEPVGERRGGHREPWGKATRARRHLREGDDLELWRRPAQEGPISSSSSASAGASEARARAAAARPASSSTRPAPPGQQRPRGGDAAARDEERALEAVLECGNEQAELERAQPLQLEECAGDLLQRSDPVAQPRSVLEAEVA